MTDLYVQTAEFPAAQKGTPDGDQQIADWGFDPQYTQDGWWIVWDPRMGGPIAILDPLSFSQAWIKAPVVTSP